MDRLDIGISQCFSLCFTSLRESTCAVLQYSLNMLRGGRLRWDTPYLNTEMLANRASCSQDDNRLTNAWLTKWKIGMSIQKFTPYVLAQSETHGHASNISCGHWCAHVMNISALKGST